MNENIQIDSSTKECGCYLVPCSSSRTCTDQFYTTKLMLHQQIQEETYAKIGLEIGPPLLQLWLLELYVFDFVTGYIVLPIVFTIECRVVIII